MKWTLYISLLFSSIAFGQNKVGLLFEEMPNDSVLPKNVRVHTSLKPQIRLSSGQTSKNYARFSPLGDLNLIQNTTTQYKTGLGGQLEAGLNDKWYFRIAAVQGISSTDSLYTPKSYILNRNQSFDLYTDIRGRLSYTPNHIFNFQAGLDHNFIGEGNRSLFLSDFGNPYPFGLIRMNFWRFEYSILYQFLKERDNNHWEGKFASSHHISFNATKWLNIGIFESVIFQPKDTNLRRGFDVEYLNPFIFYRPQEYSLGSSDNVLLGFELSADWKEHTFYSQFILDEFYLAELRAKSGWWANKFGGQLGLKGRFRIGEHRLFYRTEYNFIRPYTFAHISEELNYGNQGKPLAHPYGANFMEILGELKWQKKRWGAKLFVSYHSKGYDHSGWNFGGNIYQSYVNRPSEYGHFTTQGQRAHEVLTVLTGSYQVWERGNLNAFVENHFRQNTFTNQLNYALVVGLRSMLWNDYRNY